MNIAYMDGGLINGSLKRLAEEFFNAGASVHSLTLRLADLMDEVLARARAKWEESVGFALRELHNANAEAWTRDSEAIKCFDSIAKHSVENRERIEALEAMAKAKQN